MRTFSRLVFNDFLHKMFFSLFHIKYFKMPFKTQVCIFFKKKKYMQKVMKEAHEELEEAKEWK